MDELSKLIDRMEIVELADRFMVSLDERNFDDEWVRRFHTSDFTMESPVGDVVGLDGLAESTRVAMERYERTQHLASNHIVDLDGDRAVVRWNALMVHVHLTSTAAARGEDPGVHFDVGGRFDAEAVRTADGWRFRRMDVLPVWFNGRPPVGMEA